MLKNCLIQFLSLIWKFLWFHFSFLRLLILLQIFVKELSLWFWQNGNTFGALIETNAKCPHTNSVKGINCWQEQHWASSMETITSSIGRLGINPSRGQVKNLSRVSSKLFLVEHKRSSLPRGQYWPSSHVNLEDSMTQAIRNNIKWKFCQFHPERGESFCGPDKDFKMPGLDFVQDPEWKWKC